jgi:cysteinyl-tRNA synthetase
MSKSLGNFVLAKDLLEKYGANAVRWFFSQTQFENPINYNEELINNSLNEINKIFRTLNNAIIQLKINNHNFKYNKKVISPEFDIHMSDDLNLPNVVSLIWSQVKPLSNLIRSKDYISVQTNINYVINELRPVTQTISA